MKRFVQLFIIACLLPVALTAADKNKGDLGNLVCFLRFADEAETIFDRPIAEYEAMFNNEIQGANSVYSYFREASYNQLFWKSNFFPLANGTQIVSYQAKNEREYYQPKGQTVALNGYANELEKTSREQALIKELVEYLAVNLPEDMSIDINKDDFVDNLCIIVSGYSGISSSYLLWPHRSALQLTNVPLIHGKKVAEYLMVFDDENGWNPRVNTGVLCHEMSHTLGTYDLYHVNDKLNPIGVWDLMSDNLNVPQQMSAYTKYKYCKWLDEIPEISEPKSYTLHPVGGDFKENTAYKIKPIGSDEYFVVEYRKKEGTFDGGLPSSGLLVYRINPNSLGNVNYNGVNKFDEQYLFRPQGTTTTDGDITKAAFSAESGRTSFGGTNSFKPFYSNGTLAKFAIGNVSTCGATLSFELLPMVSQIYLPKSSASLAGVANSSTQLKIESDIAWKVGALPEWITVAPMQGEAGSSTMTITATTSNEAINYRSANFVISGSTDSSVFATVSVSQNSNIIQPPFALKASIEEGKVSLRWMAPQEGSAVLTEDFENSANAPKWEIKSANGIGWKWYVADKYVPAHAGSQLARMASELEDRHQDERFISPTFAYGKSLSFYSSSTAPGKVQNPEKDFYYVEVSKNGGETWSPVWNLMKEGTATNKYERVDIDLTNYLSDNMKIAFHAYDILNTGVSYWWNVDDISIYPQVEHSLVTQYAIYRNGIKIGTSKDCSFTDESPMTSADNVYTVKAEGAFGETPNSESVIVTAAVVALHPEEADEVSIAVVDGTLIINGKKPLAEVVLYSLAGMKVAQINPNAISFSHNLQSIPSGIYIVRIVVEGVNKPLIRKVVK